MAINNFKFGILALGVPSLILVSGLYVYVLRNKDASVNSASQHTVEQASKSAAQKDLRQTVWEQLTKEQQDLADVSWQDGTVTKIALKDNFMMMSVTDKSYIGKEVYLVNFDNGLTSIAPLVDEATLEIIGFAPVD